jgi:hypothetical protein
MNLTPFLKQSANAAPLVRKKCTLTRVSQRTQQQRAWGSDRFRQHVEALTQRAATVRPRGRPRKAPAAEEK